MAALPELGGSSKEGGGEAGARPGSCHCLRAGQGLWAPLTWQHKGVPVPVPVPAHSEGCLWWLFPGGWGSANLALDLLPDRASVSPRRRAVRGAAGAGNQCVPQVCTGASSWWYFSPLQTQSRAAAPGRALARIRRTANPSRWVRAGLKGQHYIGFGDVGVLSGFTTRQCGAEGVLLSCPTPHPQSSLLSSRTDSTDFQESFVTSGVFSVTELIQVSRSECHHHATNAPRLPGTGSIPTVPHPRCCLTPPRSRDPSLSLQHRW